jgi:hypothetical protein
MASAVDRKPDRQPPAGSIVIGPTGGKTTPRSVTGQEQPDAGAVRIGQTVELAYVDQSRETLDAEKSVWEEISAGADQIQLGERRMNSRAYVASFNFLGADQQKKVALSGREGLPTWRKMPTRRHVPPSGANQGPGVNTCARGKGRRTCRLRRRRQPRPLVPGPHLHAPAGLRGRQPGALVRGQLVGLRSGAEAEAGAGCEHRTVKSVER